MRKAGNGKLKKLSRKYQSYEQLLRKILASKKEKMVPGPRPSTGGGRLFVFETSFGVSNFFTRKFDRADLIQTA